MNHLAVRRGDPFGSLVDDVFNDFFQRSAAASHSWVAMAARSLRAPEWT